MDLAGQTPLDRAFNSGHMALAEAMLRQDRDDQKDSLRRSTPLHRAACLGLSDAVRSLLSYGANPVACDGSGETPLHKAARAGNVEATEMLAELCDVNTKSNAGLTPLHWACLAGREEVAVVLVQHGADPHLSDEHLDGLSPIAIANVMGHTELARTLSLRLVCA
jgi:ankyrin repeat protein